MNSRKGIMKSIKRTLAAIVAAIAVLCTFCLSACGNAVASDGNYIAVVDASKPLALTVGDTVDYTQYFLVMDKNGNQIVVTDDMLDTSAADTSKEGKFTVTLKIGNITLPVNFTVSKASGPSGPNTDPPSVDPPSVDPPVTDPADLDDVLAQYADVSSWNFAVAVTISDGSDTYSEKYEYYGHNIKLEGEDEFYGGYVDYLGYDADKDLYSYYYSYGSDYIKYDENTDEFLENYLYMNIVSDLSALAEYKFTKSGDKYSATNTNAAGNAVLGEFEESTWTAFTLTVKDGKIGEISAKTSDGYTYKYTFSKYGAIKFTLPDAETPGPDTPDTPVEPTGTMSKQKYDQATFDDERLQDKIIKEGEYHDPVVGLPSVGTYNALVVPVKFTDTTISSAQLSDLNIAFNGTSEQTGWESVKTYYQKSSYGKLDLSFDIAGFNLDVPYYTAKYNSSYYEKLTATDEESGQQYNNGENVLLHEVLTYYESRLDLTDYDSNGDKAIDAIYLIYSAPVDYGNDSFYWAYVTWDEDTASYDGLDAYYYLFAGLDFMNESVSGKNTNSDYAVINGLKVNASTYIHETGHLLGLDDYYDYYPYEGSDEGLGGADMMDATVGDQNVYSKIMLGWLTPEVVVSTKTVTVKSSQERGDALLIPLDFDNSYFCEYLLVDLYSANGLNQLHASASDTYLYDGASYGVRIYHVSSWIKNPFDNDYGSFTDNNNSLSDISLIKLVEADGEKKFSGSDGYATRQDLWQAGDKLSDVFPKYTTNAGKLLIFDITVDAVSATEATITITYTA